jgi:hypothetical protein
MGILAVAADIGSDDPWHDERGWICRLVASLGFRLSLSGALVGAHSAPVQVDPPFASKLAQESLG